MSGMSGHVRLMSGTCPVQCPVRCPIMSGSMSEKVSENVRCCPMMSGPFWTVPCASLSGRVRLCPVVSGRVRSCPIMSECPGCPPGHWGLSPQPEAGTGLGLGTQAQAGGSHLGARPSTPRRPRCHPRLTLDALDVPTTGTVFEGTQLYPR